jgi:hypothetical protein
MGLSRLNSADGFFARRAAARDFLLGLFEFRFAPLGDFPFIVMASNLI